MDPINSIVVVLVIVIVAWAVFRWRQRRFEEEIYSIVGDFSNRLTWISSQTKTVQWRMKRLYVLSGYLACRVNTLESAKSTFTTDRIMARLDATLQEVDNDSYQPDEHTLKSRQNLEECSRLVANAAQALLHQLAVETTRRTNRLITGEEARHIYRQELDCMGSLMHNAKVLAEDTERILSEPLIDEQEPQATQAETDI